MQQHVQRLRAAQTRMLVLSEQVSVAELASEMSEARAKLIEVNYSGIHRILCAIFSTPGVDLPYRSVVFICNKAILFSTTCNA